MVGRFLVTPIASALLRFVDISIMTEFIHSYQYSFTDFIRSFIPISILSFFLS